MQFYLALYSFRHKSSKQNMVNRYCFASSSLLWAVVNAIVHLPSVHTTPNKHLIKIKTFLLKNILSSQLISYLDISSHASNFLKF